MRPAPLRRLAAPALAAALALAAPPAASGQLLELGLGGGPSMPAQAFSDEADVGYNALGSLWVRAPALPFGVRGDVAWQSFPDDAGGDFTELSGFVSATGELPGFFLSPYGLVGVGVARHDAPDADHGGHRHVGGDDTDVGLQLGAGVRLGALGLNLFAEARYMNLGEDHAAVPLTVGLTF